MQFIDLKAQYRALKQDIQTAIDGVLEQGQYIMGKEVGQFEQSLADFVGVRHCISCGNGTDALQMVFMAYGIGKGDAVFCPDITFIASVEPACMLGATPVFCDIEADTYNLCPVALEAQIQAVLARGEHTPKAVVAVDFLGNPCRYQELKAVCDKYNLLLIEDAAQGFGGLYQGNRCGSFGDIAITSFFPAKPLGCYGDGGAIFTDNDDIADILKSIRVHGKGSSKYDNVRIGVNSRLDTLQAAILQVKFKAFTDHEIEQRQQVADRYNQAFASDFTIPFILPDCQSIYAQYAILCQSTEQRTKIIDSLNAQNIPNMVYYPTPQHALRVYEGNPYHQVEFANADHYCATTLSLPMHPYLEQDEQDIIIKAVLEAVR